MSLTAREILNTLTAMAPRLTSEAPRDRRGLYGLLDHKGNLRYIGSTSSREQSFYERIHQRHRTGSENTSHYFSYMYNTGRMWRDRNSVESLTDAKVAKDLRSAFIADHCRAIWLPLPDDVDIAKLENAVLHLAPPAFTAWNQRKMASYDEPVALVDETLHRLNWGADKLASLARQKAKFLGLSSPATKAPAQLAPSDGLPTGPFRFVALDVETANGDRASICQIGLAFVRSDNTIVTWKSHLDPLVDHWAFTYLHGIDAKIVKGAPNFATLLPKLIEAIGNLPVYQHSGFDRSAFSAACIRDGIQMPSWEWRDSVGVARTAWPELKGNGGHGLASLKAHLGLVFDHHDAGEDARAAAQIVLCAEGVKLPITAQEDDTFDLIEQYDAAPTVSKPIQGGAPSGLKRNEDNEWFTMRPEIAMAYGKPVPEGFLVRSGSTTMRDGSPTVKRNRVLRDRLVNEGVLVEDRDGRLYRFVRDYVFDNSSAAGGVVKDGNCSGPQSWLRQSDGNSLKDVSCRVAPRGDPPGGADKNLDCFQVIRPRL